ncbi:MAG: hypothetical protein GY720_02565 [bacterium]|nr:hypothetical protein [bacterium]
MHLLLALLLSVTLSPPFGEASATLIGFTPSEVTFEVMVEVLDPAAIVLMRGEDIAGNEIEPVALISRGDGKWGAVVVLPARSDLRIVFESIPERGGSTLSEASSLVDLGIDPDVLALVERRPPTEPDTSRPGILWVVLAVVAALAALILLTIWTRLGRAEDGDDPDEVNDEDLHTGFDGVGVDGG